MNLTKEDIRKLKQACERFSSTLEEVEKPTVEEGQYWESNCTDKVYRINKISGGQVYHRAIDEERGIGDRNWSMSEFVVNYHLLSDDEVEQALKKEAIRRGFDYHNFECMAISGWDNADQGGYEYHSDVDVLYLGCNACYYGGDWAEILEDEWGAVQFDSFSKYKVENNDRRIMTVSGARLTKQEAEAIAKALNDL